MRITCPSCQFKGLIDTAPLAFETHVACVRCGTTFEALLIEGEVQTILLPNDEEELEPQEALPASPVLIMQGGGGDAEDVLALPQTQNGDPLDEQVRAFEDVLTVLPVESLPEAEDDVLTTRAEERSQEAVMAVSEEAADRKADEPHIPEVVASVDTKSFKSDSPSDATPAVYGNHGAGMRLMRISPLWLVVCGMTFISVIVLSNHFARPAVADERVAANYSAQSNKAANQSFPQPIAPASANADTASAQVAAPAQVESKDEGKAVEDKASAEAEPKPVAAPVAAAKEETVASVPQAQGEKAGGITVQVGSYNAIEEANGRLASLRAAGFEARVIAVEIPKRGTWYRVQAGRFGSREDAARHGSEIKAKGIADTFIITEAGAGK